MCKNILRIPGIMESNIKVLGVKSNQYMLGASGIEQMQRVYLHRGTRIIAHGYGMCVQYFVIYDDEMNAVEIFNGNDVNAVDEYELDKYFTELHRVEDTVRPISKKFGIGFYYDESGVLVDDETIAKSLERAKVMAQFRKDVAERKAKESEDKTERLKRDYSYLKRVDNKYDHKICGENIRTELKRNFPTTKFSVRYKSFSGGDEYSITWQDGPTTKQVDAIVDKYGDMKPDAYSMGDYWDCVPSEFNHLYGSVGYVMTSRTISADALNKTKEKFADVTEDNMQTYPYGIEGANSYAHNYAHRSVDDMMHWLARSIDWQEVVPKQDEKQSAVCGNFEIVDYSDKSFAVVGDTKSIKDDLKRLGGRFNFRLSCGAGWIFPTTKIDDVKALPFKHYDYGKR